jgi:hypothetical protein
MPGCIDAEQALSRQVLSNRVEVTIDFREEVEVLIVTEEHVYVVRIGQEISTPANQHRDL